MPFGEDVFFFFFPLTDHDCSELCRTTEDLSPEDKAAELLPLSVQHLYILIKLDRLDEAESVAKEISVSEYVLLIGNIPLSAHD